MKRREALSKFVGLSAFALFGSFGIFKFARPYKVVIFNTPKGGSKKTFNDAGEFWSEVDDTFSIKLNDEFMRNGRLLSVNSYVSADKKSVVLEKFYRSKADHLEYVSRLESIHLQQMYSKKTHSRAYC